MKYFSLLFFLLFTSLSISQGKVSGLIMDGEYDEPMAFANVIVKNSSIGTTSDFDGKYELSLDPGSYTLIFSFVGYSTIEITDVTISEESDEIVNVTLLTNMLDEVVISTTVRKNTESAVLDIQKKSTVMLDGISSQGIKKAGASNIAGAVKAVPGVSVQGGKYVYVRGLGDRYTKSILNGVDIPGLDPDRNTIQMDIFPTNILENIIVIKSAAAEYPADFTGGVIDIVTKDFPTKRELSISIASAYNSKMHFNNAFLIGEAKSTDLLGFDNGARDIPIDRYQQIPGTFANDPLLTQLTNSFDPILKAKNKTSMNDFSFGFTAGNQFDLNDDKLGFQVSMSYKNETSFYKNRIDNRLKKDSNDNSILNLVTDRLSIGDQGSNNVILNALAGLVYKRERSKYKFNMLHIQNGENIGAFFNQQASQGTGGGGIEQATKDVVLYTQRSVTNFLLNGTHSFENDWKLEWKVSPSLSNVFDKDHKNTALYINDEGNYSIQPSSFGYPTRTWRELKEINFSNQLNVLKKYTIKENPAKLKFGLSATIKNRDFEVDSYFFKANPNYVVDGNANNILAAQNIWTVDSGQGTFLDSNNIYQPSNSYEGAQTIFAAYLANEFDLFKSFKTIIGIRAEQFESNYTGQNQSGTAVFNNSKKLFLA